MLDAADYVAGLGLKNVVDTDAVFATFFLYCSLAGEACVYATGSGPEDVYVRFENTVGQLDVAEAQTKGWVNSSSLEMALEGVKQLVLGATYLPLMYFGPLAQALVQLEELLEDLTSDSLEEWLKRGRV
ncbi:hypothetical protein OIDMADRAFT_35109 [Oidiodendron maius Zn]|uniref:Uncharacterized protein n=1 Tax=Oidiodendron maius (strain Zn) TaxID=913774 RepID=A0A0C3GUI6_OIDMZ|nr:hypothetical protein OIDMADRAFT_35109 [Oidiodendron maius Zn]